jgi:hypothetical protein
MKMTTLDMFAVPKVLIILDKSDVPTAKVGKVPALRASDTDTDLPTVSTDLFSRFQYLKNCFIASK